MTQHLPAEAVQQRPLPTPAAPNAVARGCVPIFIEQPQAAFARAAHSAVGGVLLPHLGEHEHGQLEWPGQGLGVCGHLPKTATY
jgi:hypothetical protein